MGYNAVALDVSITGKVPAEISDTLPPSSALLAPPKLKILHRCTLHLSDPSQNHRLTQISAAYDIFALRPTTEKTLQQACHSLECDLISLDFSIRHPYYFQIKTVKSALDRGIKFEICYAPGILNTDGGASRRNLISNATQLIRATRGRGIIISSEAKSALACRGPADVINLAVIWGLGREGGVEAVGREARSVVIQAEMRRRSFRGVIDIVYGGEAPVKLPAKEQLSKNQRPKGKRKVEAMENDESTKNDPPVIRTSPRPISKRERKRQAQRDREESSTLESSKLQRNFDKVLMDNETPVPSALTNSDHD